MLFDAKFVPKDAHPALIDYVAKFPPNIMQISEPLQKIGANKVP